MGMGVSPQSLDSSTARGTSAVTTLIIGLIIIGLISIIATALIVFMTTNVFSGDSSETTNIGLPTAQFIGMDINGTPGKVNYLILRVANPSSREDLTVSGQDLTIVYQDESGNIEEVSYPAMDTGVGLIADARDVESIDACSELANQPNNTAIWCFVNDGFSPSISPGMSGDIYVFLGGLSIPLRENIEFSIDVITSNPEIVITAKGITPRVFQLPATADTPTPAPAPTPTLQLVVTPLEIPISPTAAPPLQPPPALPAILPPAPPAVLPPAPAPTPTATAPLPTPTAKPVVLLPLPPRDTMKRPHVLVGVAKINGASAPTGTKVTAWVDGYDAPLGTTDVKLGGSFTVLVEQYGSVLIQGQTSLILKIGDKTTPQTVKWVEGGADVINLEIS